MVDAGRQRDLAAQVRGRYLQPQLAVMLWHHAVHRVVEHDVGLARRQARLDQLLEQRTRIYRTANRSVLGRFQLELGPVAHGLHELVGQQHAVMQVQRLAVEIARGFADLEELLDLRVADVEIACRRSAPQRSLADRERQAVHHPHEGDDAAGLAIQPHRLPDAAHIAPIGADPAALAGEPDILVPGADDAVQAVLDAVEIAADRQAARGAAIGEDGGRGHEPQVRDVIVQSLRVILVVGIGIRDAGEQVLVALARQQVPVVQSLLAEHGEVRIARGIGRDGEAARIDLLAVGRGVGRGLGRGGHRLCRFGHGGSGRGGQRGAAGIVLRHGHRLSVFRTRVRFIDRLAVTMRRVVPVKRVGGVAVHVVARLEIHVRPASVRIGALSGRLAGAAPLFQFCSTLPRSQHVRFDPFVQPCSRSASPPLCQPTPLPAEPFVARAEHKS